MHLVLQLINRDIQELTGLLGFCLFVFPSGEISDGSLGL